MISAFCRWYEKEIEKLAEHEQGQCDKYKQECIKCPCLSYEVKEKENE